MPALTAILTLRPLVLRRALLVLFAGPILLLAMIPDGSDDPMERVGELCGLFETAWAGMEMADLASFRS